MARWKSLTPARSSASGVKSMRSPARYFWIAVMARLICGGGSPRLVSGKRPRTRQSVALRSRLRQLQPRQPALAPRHADGAERGVEQAIAHGRFDFGQCAHVRLLGPDVFRLVHR